MNYKQISITLSLLLFTACGGGGATKNTPTPDDKVVSCEKTTNSFMEKQYDKRDLLTIDNSFTSIKLLTLSSKLEKEEIDFDKKGLYQLFQTEYFWADKVNKYIDVSTYTNPNKLIDDVKYQKDRWSFAITPKDYNDAVSQVSIGTGFYCQDMSEGCFVVYVDLDSPADKIDIRRSDIIKTINGKKATRAGIEKAYLSATPLELELVRHQSNESCIGTVTAKEYSYKVVYNKIVQTQKNEKVGYLRLDSFLGDEKIITQLDNAFKSFKTASIEKLVIDLRYNGGGSVDIASKLLNKLTINKEGLEQFTLAWNKVYSSKNDVYTFKKSSNALDLKQVLFLTTKNSASASELVISAMHPYLPQKDVVIIGDDTHGKPVGMSGKSDGAYYYFIINFMVQNSLGFYDYFEGLPVTPTCDINDDPFHEMGDPKESMLKAALLYIDTESCR